MSGEEPPNDPVAASEPAAEPVAEPPAAVPSEDRDAAFEADEPGPTFRLVVAVLIAIVSVLGAGVAWSASTASNTSSDLDQSAQQDYLLQQQILTSARALIGEDLRRVADFSEELNSMRVLKSQAAQFSTSDPPVAAVLAQQAQGQAALARTTGSQFFLTAPGISADDTVTYSQKQALANALSEYVIYQQLHPADEQVRADKADRKYRQIVLVGVLLVAALFFLTVAEFGKRRVRHLVVVLGVVALVAACVVWPLAGSGSL